MTTKGAQRPPTQLELTCQGLRGAIGTIGKQVLALKHDVLALKDRAPEDTGEMLANVMLAYRHLEDARMRLGKVIQAYDGGTSVYDK